ncbi:MAG: hypothetical protein CL678_09100 [Bdellovibrionaceae bacterium]|nr:hypothetical protein [Pseudobdellovibrionaceae bacterium]
MFQLGQRAYKPFDLVAPSVKCDQLVQFESVKRALHEHQSALAIDVDIDTMRLRGKSVSAISMPYSPFITSLDKQPDWHRPTQEQMRALSTWLDNIIAELQRCRVIMLDFKMANILGDSSKDTFMLCDWDSLATLEDATTFVDDISPIPRGTYDPFCSDHPATFTEKALKYAMIFAAAVTISVAYYNRIPQLSRPLNATDLEKRYRAMRMRLSTCLGDSPAWFVMPSGLVEELVDQGFFLDQ